MYKKHLLLLSLLLCNALLYGQNINSGKVTDHLAEPLPGVTVQVKQNQQVVTTTNADGIFSLTISD